MDGRVDALLERLMWRCRGVDMEGRCDPRVETTMSTPAPEVQYSPDGSHWWNGPQWLPVVPPPKRKSSPMAVLGRVPLAVGIFGGVAAVIGANSGSSGITDQEVHDPYCESFGNRSEHPSCS